MQITKRVPVKHLVCGINPMHSSELSNAFSICRKKKYSLVVLPLQYGFTEKAIITGMFHYPKLLKKKLILTLRQFF